MTMTMAMTIVQWQIQNRKQWIEVKNKNKGLNNKNHWLSSGYQQQKNGIVSKSKNHIEV